MNFIASQHEGNKIRAMLNQCDFSTKVAISMWQYHYDSSKSLMCEITLMENCRCLSLHMYTQWRHCTVVKNMSITCLSKNILFCTVYLIVISSEMLSL